MERRRAELFLLLTTLIWGGTFTTAKQLLDGGLDPVALMAWRFTLASVIFGAIYARRIVRRADAATILNGCILGFFLWLGFGMQTFGLDATSSSRSGFITALYVIFTPILQTAFTRRLPARRVLVGVVLVVIGLAALTSPGGTLSGLLEPWKAGGFSVGDALTLGCALAFAIYIVVLDRVSRDNDDVVLTAAQFATVALLSLGHMVLIGRFDVPSSAPAWGGMLYLAVLATVVATFVQTRYQRDTSPTRAAVIFTMESVFAAILAAVILGERLGPVALAGGALIITGLLVTELGGRANTSSLAADSGSEVPTSKRGDPR